MKRLFRFLAISIIFFFILPAISFSITRGIKVTDKRGENLYLYEDYHALIVGISDYERWPKLPNAANDAKEVAKKLKTLGFKVKLVLDPTYREMRTVLNEMIYQIGNEKSRALLFYYAGHGETETLADETKMGYVIPKDCPLLEQNPMGFGTHAISMRDIESISLRIKAKHVLMLFDSCFSGSLFALVRAVPAAISEKSALPVRQFITAGREDEQVPDKSMFKRCLLIGLEGDADLTGDGYITGSELGMYLSEKVVNYTHRRQHPQYGKINNPDLDRGDFIFVPIEVRQKEAAEDKKRQQENYALAEDMKRMQEKLKSLEAKSRNEKMKKEGLLYKKPLEEKLEQSEEKLQQEAAKRKALEEELQRIKAQMKQRAESIKEIKAKETDDKRLAYVPKEVKKGEIQKMKLRDTQKVLFPHETKKMIEAHNFYVKKINEEGDFPNDFIDNGDGTITDRTTGLMWGKGSSSKLYQYYMAEKYISGLNNKEYGGYNDWRIPTLEELCSLLEKKKNGKGLYISPLFDDKQSLYLNLDRPGGARTIEFCALYYGIDFKTGCIGEVVTDSRCQSRTFCVKAVRTSKGKQGAESIKEVKAKETGDNRLDHISKGRKKGEIQKIKLRDTQKVLYGHEIKKMIKAHNFYVKKINEEGDFPNDFIDNGDGTITDRTTGLMWGKGSSSKLYRYYRAEKYISGLNNKEFAGYKDWRIPTLEELCSLLERMKNEKGLHISPLFDDKQSLYLNLDRPGETHYMESCAIYHAIDLKKGVISEVATGHENWCQTKTFYVKAVRTAK